MSADFPLGGLGDGVGLGFGPTDGARWSFG